MTSKIILTSEKHPEVVEARSLKIKLENFETVFLIVLETKILENINIVSQMLQSAQQNILDSSKLLKNARYKIQELRNQFDEIKNEAILVARKWGVKDEFSEKRISRPKLRFDDKHNNFLVQTNEDLFRINTFYKTMDILISQLLARSAGLELVVEDFKPIMPEILLSSNDDEIFKMAEKLRQKYITDISDSLAQQLLSFRHCFSEELKNEKINSVKDLLEFILIKNTSSSTSFTEIITACFIFLTIPVTVASAERSFSVLKLIKTYLRNTMGQNRLSSLALISIENEVARSLDLTEIINVFATKKGRKVKF